MKIFVLSILIFLAGCTQGNSSNKPENDAPKLQIIEATFGLNCQGFVVPSPWKNTVFRGNATEKVKEACDGQSRTPSSCTYVVHLNVIPDPAPTCMKGFDIRWRCGEQLQATHLGVSADGATLVMSCAPQAKNGPFVAHD